MESDKPFKTIEVVDSRTTQVCKVACMSCIRGHRTTSCGIPVCRNKIFWTVKRPGRPSNSCTCRYRASGRCKCVVARSACPHKAKKGEKRSGECRCDEQGRYCCTLELGHWNLLLSLRKPTVDFYPTREALEAVQTATTTFNLPPTPAHSSNSPASFTSTPTTPAPTDGARFMSATPTPYDEWHSPRSTALTPRFGMMGIGAPQGSEDTVTPNVLSWEGQSPQAPHPYSPLPYHQLQSPPDDSCCQNPQSSQFSIPSTHYMAPPPATPDLSQHPHFAPMNGVFPNVRLPPEQPASLSEFDYDKMTIDYMHYQLPNAICQNCGLNGCTCKNCPPVLQNFSTGSWAQCCGRKHARVAAAAAAAAPAPSHHPLGPDLPRFPEEPHPHFPTPPPPFFGHAGPFAGPGGYAPMASPPPPGPPPPFAAFDLDRELTAADAAAAAAEMDLSELLMSELDRPTGGSGCCCGDP